MTLYQKLAAALGTILALVGSWFAGKRAGSRETVKTINLEQRAGQVEVLKTDVTIDQQADDARREVESRPEPDATITNMKAFIERNRK